MATNKNQHFVPRCYLREFTVDGTDRAISLYNIDRDRFIEGAPVKNQCSGDYMPTAATLSKTAAHLYDPLEPLADAIGSMTGALSGQVADALHQVLEAATPQSRNARLLLIRHLVDVESQTVGIGSACSHKALSRGDRAIQDFGARRFAIMARDSGTNFE